MCDPTSSWKNNLQELACDPTDLWKNKLQDIINHRQEHHHISNENDHNNDNTQ